MDFIKERDKRFTRLDGLVGELDFYLNAYANGSTIENEDSSDINKTKKMLEITQEMYVIENELEFLSKFIEMEEK